LFGSGVAIFVSSAGSSSSWVVLVLVSIEEFEGMGVALRLLLLVRFGSFGRGYVVAPGEAARESVKSVFLVAEISNISKI
jgi:hypothetical protein